MPRTPGPARRPARHAEATLVADILGGRLVAGQVLPAERELALALGVTRPTLREALARLSRDGFVRLRHGKATEVTDVRREGGLGVLAAVAEHGRVGEWLPALLDVRAVLAPAYARQAVRRAPRAVEVALERAGDLPDTAPAYAEYDWELHRALAHASGNPVHALILNGFEALARSAGERYFRSARSRSRSRRFYAALADAVRQRDAVAVEQIVRQAMRESGRAISKEACP